MKNVIYDTKLVKEEIENGVVEEYYDYEIITKNQKDLSSSIFKNIKKVMDSIENKLYDISSFISMIKSTIPEENYRAILTGEQKEKLANGTLKMMSKSDGTLVATLINPKTGKIVSKINMEKINLTPDINREIANYTSQMQLAQIAEQIQFVQLAVEEVRQGQENDRLAIAYSCKQKLLQALSIKDDNTKKIALLNLISSAEDSRNKLMLSQNTNVNFIANQPDSFIGKFLNNVTDDEISKKMNDIRESLNAINMVSLAQAIAYQEIGENESAKISLSYYSDFINKTYLEVPGLIKRLDNIDPSPVNYWSKNLPKINDKINLLTECDKKKLIGDLTNEK